MGKATNSIARKGSRGKFPLAGCRGGAPAGAWGNAPTVPRTTGMSNALNKGAGSEASLPVTLRIRRCAPQAALSINSTLSRQMGATDQHGRRFSLDAGLFRCRRKTESVSYRNRKPPAAAGQSSLCTAGVVMQLENALTPARTASCTARRRSRLFAAAPRACRIR